MSSRNGSASRNGSRPRAALLAPEFLAKLERLALLARRPVRGCARIPRLIETLGGAQAHGQTTLNAALSGYASRLRSGGVAVLISDLLDPQGYEAGLQALLERQVDLHLIHVLAPDELDPARRPELRGDLRLTDVETGEARMLTVDGEALAGYRERLAEFLAR